MNTTARLRHQAAALCFASLVLSAKASGETVAAQGEPAQGEVDEIEGVVRVVGPSATAEIQLDPGSGNKGPAVCRGDVAKRIGKLTGYTVKVKGPWQLRKGKKQCVTPDEFTVTKASSGRAAIVGTLSQTSGSYTLASVDGKTHPLSDIPSGLKKLDGKKVIVDLKPSENPATKEATYKVVTYSAFPE
jgi:copper chaperone CopZ